LDLSLGCKKRRADAHENSITSVIFSPDGKTVISAASLKGGGDEIKVSSAEDGHARMIDL
jgi:hypothetical protein